MNKLKIDQTKYKIAEVNIKTLSETTWWSKIKSFKEFNELKLTDNEIVDNFNMLIMKLKNDELCQRSSTNYCLCDNHHLKIKRNNDVLIAVHQQCTFKEKSSKDKIKMNIVYGNYNQLDTLHLLSSKDTKNYDDGDKSILLKLFMSMKKSKKLSNFYLSGPFQSGKTYLVTGMANHFALDHSISYLKTRSFIAEIKSYFNNKNSIEPLINKIKKCDILILDELGSESFSEYFHMDLFATIIEYRLQFNKTVWISANFDISGLRKHYLNNSTNFTDSINFFLNLIEKTVIKNKFKLTSQIKN